MVWFADPEHFHAGLLAAMVSQATGGDLHIVLAPTAVWISSEARAQAAKLVEREIARYTNDADERDEPDFRDIAELLSRPPEARYGWIADTTGGTKLTALVAGNSWFGLVAVREGDDVWIRTFKREQLSRVLAEVLPENAGRGSGNPVSVLRSEMRKAEATGQGSPAVRQAQRIVSLEPHIIAEFSAETRGGDGKRRRSPQPLRVYDTENGRWTLLVRPHYSDEQLNFAPATTSDVAALLDELRRGVVPQ